MDEQTADEPTIIQHEEDVESAGSVDMSYYKAAAFAQWGHLLLLVLKMKIWWFLLLPIPVMLLVSSIFSQQLMQPIKHVFATDFKFYGLPNLLSEGRRVLVDESSFQAEVAALKSVRAQGEAEHSAWLQYCLSESTCRTEFIAEKEQVAAYIRFSDRPNDTRSVTDCYLQKDSSIRCAFIFYLMSTALLTKMGLTDKKFSDVKFFELKQFQDQTAYKKDIEDAAHKLRISKSVCADWIGQGLQVFEKNTDVYVESALFLGTIGVALYFVICNAGLIRAFKASGFLPHLFRNGLSVSGFWTIVWFITLCEALLFSGLLVMSFVVQCPGIYPVKDGVAVFFMFTLHCLLLAGVSFLIGLLIPYMIAALMTMLLISLAIFLSFSLNPNVATTNSLLPFIFPSIHTKDYIVAHMTSDIRRQITDEDNLWTRNAFYLSVVLSVAGFVVFIVFLNIYLDYLLMSGNGFNLPAYYPFSCRFWYPDIADDDDRVHLANKAISDPSIEPVTGLSAALIVDRVSKSYNAWCCFCPGNDVLHNISCIAYRDQITALVGHKGVGKTTLLKILTGELAPSSGVAYVAGYRATDPFDRLAAIGMVSFTPPLKSLRNSLTSMEWIKSFLISRGANFPSELDRAHFMLQRLGVRGIEIIKTEELSVSQRRKLSTVIALLADPGVIFLDEPTRDLDPLSAQQVWELLRSERRGRSIIVATDSMKEADFLADRKIVFCDRGILCAGSSAFLKRYFKCKTTLTVRLKSDVDESRLVDQLEQWTVRRISENENEIEFEMKSEDAFEVLINTAEVLEANKDIVAKYTVSQASISDVFATFEGRRMSAIVEKIQSGQLSDASEDETSSNPGSALDLSESVHVKVSDISPSVFSIFKAMFIVNIKRQVRVSVQTVLRLVLPILFIVALVIATGLTMHSYNRDDQINSTLSREETDSYKDFYSVKSRVFSNEINPKIVCMRDEEAGKIEENSFCSELQFIKNAEVPSHVVPKSKSLTMETFLQEPSTLRHFRKGCGDFSENAVPCLVFYASSWNKTWSNNVRSIVIGVFINSVKLDLDTAHLLRRGFLQISEYFNVSGLRKATALSHIKPVSEFGYYCVEMQLFFATLGIFSVSFVMDIAEDVTSKVRLQYMVFGLRRTKYWLYTFWVHWIQYILITIASAAMLLIWDRYRNLHCGFQIYLPAILLATITNQLAAYIVARLAKSSRVCVPVCYLIFTLLMPVAMMILMKNQNITLVTPLILAVPSVAQYSLGYFSALRVTYLMEYYQKDKISDVPDTFTSTWNTNNMYLLSLASVWLQLVICFWLLNLVDRWEVVRSKYIATGDSNECDTEESRHPEVVNEENRLLESLHNPQNVLEVLKARTSYPNGVEAIKGVTFGAMAGETFGLLGSRGAGKTTLLSLVVKTQKLTEGSCQARSRDSNWPNGLHSNAVGAIGYCPQASPLYDCITVDEHLFLYSQILGVPSSKASKQTYRLIVSLELAKQQNSQCRTLSEGDKRRLCLALALLGDPALIVIDQNTSGVDQKTRKLLQNATRSVKHQSRSVLFATNRMGDADALCDRVGILHRGRLVALSTVQELRRLRDEVYTIEAELEQYKDEELRRNRTNLKGSIAGMFEGTTIICECGLRILFSVPKSSTKGFLDAMEWLDINAKVLGVRLFILRNMAYDEIQVYLIGRQDGNTLAASNIKDEKKSSEKSDLEPM